MAHDDYTPWDLPEQVAETLPDDKRRWVRELKARRRLYQAVALLSLVAWLGYVLFLLIAETYAESAAPAPGSGAGASMGAGLNEFFGIVYSILFAGIGIGSTLGATLQLAKNTALRITGYIFGIGANLLGILITDWYVFQPRPAASQVSTAAVWAGWIIIALACFSILATAVLMIANLKLRPYLRREETAPPVPPPADEPPVSEKW
ncbi:MAG: hypothetical protein ACREJ2_11375 [Planctomycetota bacterium]